MKNDLKNILCTAVLVAGIICSLFLLFMSAFELTMSKELQLSLIGLIVIFAFGGSIKIWVK